MPLTEKEKLFLERAERAGVKVDWAAHERAFNFSISGVITLGIDISVFIRLGELVTAQAERSKFSCELSAIVFFPIICDAAIYSRKDILSYKRKSKSYFVGKNIEHDVWIRARKPKRIKLASESLKFAVQSLNEKYLSREKKVEIIAMIESAVEAVSKE